MRLGITAKLFLTLLILCVMTVVAMSVASRITFTRGFLGYLNEQGVERAERVLPVIADAYQRHGSWDFVRGRWAWLDLLRHSRAVIERAAGQPPERLRRNYDLLGLDTRLTLLDADRRYIAGNVEVDPTAPTWDIRVNGRVVGYLTVRPFQQVTRAADLRFQQQQQRMTWLIAAASVALAALAAVWLTRRLLRDVRQVAHSVHRLAAGDYTARVPVVARDEIGLLADDCNQLAQTLQRTEQMRREFMADVSHELRTPLAVLRAELEAIEDGVRRPTLESIRSLQGEVATLSKLVDDLYNLSLSDIGALAYRMEEIDVGAVLYGVLESFQARLAERHIRVVAHGLEAGLRIRGDEDRLRQLFGNIFENTLRYTDPGGVLHIDCRKQEGWLLIDYQDSEPGVPEGLLSRIFERFYRVEGSRSRAGGGAGLGLAICKNIVEAHGGTIIAKPSDFGGLRLAIALPAAWA